MFILEIGRSCLLTYLQGIFVPHQIDWGLTKSQDGVPIGNFKSQGPYQDDLDRYVTGILSGRIAKDQSLGELPRLANTFINDFLRVRGQFLAKNFCTPGWIYSIDRMWWSKMVSFVLKIVKPTIKDIGLLIMSKKFVLCTYNPILVINTIN